MTVCSWKLNFASSDPGNQQRVEGQMDSIEHQEIPGEESEEDEAWASVAFPVGGAFIPEEWAKIPRTATRMVSG